MAPDSQPGSITLAVNSLVDMPMHVQQRIEREIRKLAANVVGKESRLAREPSRLTITVNGAWIKLCSTGPWTGREHFFGAVCKAIRQVLVDEAKFQEAAKRSARSTVSWEEVDPPSPGSDVLERTLEIDEQLNVLAQIDQRAADIVERRLFGGFSTDLIACQLGVSQRTVQRDLEFAARFCRMEL